MQSELTATGRLPGSVKWIDEIADTLLPQRLRFAARQTGCQRFVLIDGNTNYNPALIRHANEWTGENGVLALTSGRQFAGIYALSIEMLQRFWEQAAPERTNPFEALHSSLTAKHPVVSMDVSEDLWQRVSTEQDCRVAEEEVGSLAGQTHGWLLRPVESPHFHSDQPTTH